MSPLSTRCRLCINNCNESVPLYYENGRRNRPLYEITVKYFHPMALSLISGSDLRVLCMECWRQISHFHNFHDAVLMAQSQLLEIQDTHVSLRPNVAPPPTAALTTHGRGVLNELMDVDNNNVITISSDDETDITTRIDKSSRTSSPLYDESSKVSDGDSEQDKEGNNSGHDEEDYEDEEYDDPVGVFVGGEFSNEPERMQLDADQLNTYDQRPLEINKNENSAKTERQDQDNLPNNSLETIKLSAESADARENCVKTARLEQRNLSNNSLETNKSFNMIDSAESDTSNEKMQNKSLKTNTSISTNVPDEPATISDNIFRTRTPSEDLDKYIAKWKQYLECPICGECFLNFAYLDGHFKMAHPGEKCYILCCQRKFYVRCTLTNHIRVHMQPTEGGATQNKNNSHTTLSRPNLSNRGADKSRNRKKQTQESTDGNVIRTRTPIEELDKFIAIWRKELECPICNKTFPDFAYLRGHFKMTHTNEKCYILCCQRKLYARSLIVEHVRHHMESTELGKGSDHEHANLACAETNHEEKSTTSTEPANPTAKKFRVRSTLKELDNFIAKWRKELQCPLCNEAFPNFALLDGHFKMRHPEEKCHILCCLHKLHVRSVIVEHIRVHIADKEIPCELCGKVCQTINSLNRHKLRRHSKSNVIDYTK